MVRSTTVRWKKLKKSHFRETTDYIRCQIDEFFTNQIFTQVYHKIVDWLGLRYRRVANVFDVAVVEFVYEILNFILSLLMSVSVDGHANLKHVSFQKQLQVSFHFAKWGIILCFLCVNWIGHNNEVTLWLEFPNSILT